VPLCLFVFTPVGHEGLPVGERRPCKAELIKAVISCGLTQFAFFNDIQR